MHLGSNGGTLVMDKQGEVPGYPNKVWFDKNAMTNILSLTDVKKTKMHNIVYESEIGFMMENKKNRNVIIFRENDGLFTAPLQASKEMQEQDTRILQQLREDQQGIQQEIALLNTVEENKQLFTKKQVARAEAARELCQVI